MRDAGWRWRALTDEERAAFGKDAVARADAKSRDLLTDVQNIKDDMDLAEVRHRDEAVARGIQYRMSAVRFDDVALDRIRDLLARDAGSRSALWQLREARCSSPKAPSLVAQGDVVRSAIDLPETTEAGDITDFLRIVAKHRDLLRKFVIVFEDDVENRAFVFLFATQTPLRAYFACLKFVQPTRPRVSGLPWMQQLSALRAVRRFHLSVQPGEYCTDRFLQRCSGKPMWVISPISWQPGGHVVADSLPMPFDHFVSRSGRCQISSLSLAPGALKNQAFAKYLFCPYPTARKSCGWPSCEGCPCSLPSLHRRQHLAALL